MSNGSVDLASDRWNSEISRATRQMRIDLFDRLCFASSSLVPSSFANSFCESLTRLFLNIGKLEVEVFAIAC